MKPHDALRAKRKSRKLLQAQLAELLGCSQPTISQLENGEAKPSGPLAIRIEDELGIKATSWWAEEAKRCA
jgi:transcriptional regulator with XRE-family HTH domain